MAMTPTERSQVALAAKLLAKAESTDSDEEAVSLALRAYSLLAEWLNRQDAREGGPRRRERRLLVDRRNLRRAWQVLTPAGSPFGASGGRRRGAYGSHEEPPRRIDLRA